MFIHPFARGLSTCLLNAIDLFVYLCSVVYPFAWSFIWFIRVLGVYSDATELSGEDGVFSKFVLGVGSANLQTKNSK